MSEEITPESLKCTCATVQIDAARMLGRFFVIFYSVVSIVIVASGYEWMRI